MSDPSPTAEPTSPPGWPPAGADVVRPGGASDFDSPWFDPIRVRLGYPVGSRAPPPAKSRGPVGGGQGGDGRGNRRFRGSRAAGPIAHLVLCQSLILGLLRRNPA